LPRPIALINKSDDLVGDLNASLVKMTNDAQRRDFWMKAVLTRIPTWATEDAAKYADDALAEFDKRFLR